MRNYICRFSVMKNEGGFRQRVELELTVEATDQSDALTKLREQSDAAGHEGFELLGIEMELPNDS